MSSENLPRKLNESHADALNKVLFDAGYSGDVVSPGAGTNAATKLLISLFHEGVTDPVHFSTALERAFGRSDPVVFHSSTLHQYAIRGLPPANDRRLRAVRGAPEEPRNVVD
ncbi:MULTISPECIES: hypothetical protein [unclassified Rhizobium]|uniref:hypothetical protein n=1 Tax=unclassified Rhizobium TaxID=2613769 RepID=UPI0009F6C236|nr:MULTISPECIES: hypothetical protein [unclassified Rhizobium]MDM9622039.1 hypothetical protein [Rhizobium sp. S96]